jgi:hypothetical protein
MSDSNDANQYFRELNELIPTSAVACKRPIAAMTGGSTTGGSMTAGSMALRIDDRRINGLDIPPLSDVRVEMAVYTMQPMPPGQIQGREPHSLGSAAAGNCFL